MEKEPLTEENFEGYQPSMMHEPELPPLPKLPKKLPADNSYSPDIYGHDKKLVRKRDLITGFFIVLAFSFIAALIIFSYGASQGWFSPQVTVPLNTSFSSNPTINSPVTVGNNYDNHFNSTVNVYVTIPGNITLNLHTMNVTRAVNSS